MRPPVADPDPRRTALVIWIALVAGVTTFAGVVLALGPVGNDPATGRIFLLVSGVLSVVTVIVSHLLAMRLRPAGQPPGPDLARTRLVVGAALCEGGALAALAMLLASGEPLLLLPFVLSYAGLLSHFPSDRRWARLLGTAPAEATPNRMMRR